MNFLIALFDFTFTRFVTTKIIKILYGIFVLLAGIAALFAIIRGFDADTTLGVVMLLLSPIIFLIYVILARMWLELVIVIFRIAEDVAEIAKQGR